MTPNALNEQVVGYVDFVEVWAAIEPFAPKRGGESYAAAQIQAEGYTQIRIRYRPDVDPTMRIKFLARHDSPQIVEFYDVDNVTHTNEARRETVFLCRKRYADGFRSGG